MSWVTPANFVRAGLLAAGLSFTAGPLRGSGILRANPVAVFWCGIAVACGIGYALLRLWRDRKDGLVRSAVFAVALIITVAAFANAQHSVWGYNRLPRMSLRHEYWRSILVCAVSLAAVTLYSAAAMLFHLWTIRVRRFRAEGLSNGRGSVAAPQG